MKLSKSVIIIECVGALTYLAKKSHILVVTPKVGGVGHVERLVDVPGKVDHEYQTEGGLGKRRAWMITYGSSLNPGNPGKRAM